MKFKNTAGLMKRIVQKSKLTQTEIAKITGVHLQFISNIMRGISGFPAKRIHRLNKFAGREEFEKAAVADFVESWRAQLKK